MPGGTTNDRIFKMLAKLLNNQGVILDVMSDHFKISDEDRERIQ